MLVTFLEWKRSEFLKSVKKLVGVDLLICMTGQSHIHDLPDSDASSEVLLSGPDNLKNRMSQLLFGHKLLRGGKCEHTMLFWCCYLTLTGHSNLKMQHLRNYASFGSTWIIQERAARARW
jgi:hypothetical protein